MSSLSNGALWCRIRLAFATEARPANVVVGVGKEVLDGTVVVEQEDVRVEHYDSVACVAFLKNAARVHPKEQVRGAKLFALR